MIYKKLNKATSVPLPSDKKIRNSKMSQLEMHGMIHNEKVFNIAKQIIVGNKKQTKREKARRKLVINHFISSISSIYIDEAQDLDYVALTRTKCNLILGIYTKGDKQIISEKLQKLGINKYEEGKYG